MFQHLVPEKPASVPTPLLGRRLRGVGRAGGQEDSLPFFASESLVFPLLSERTAKCMTSTPCGNIMSATYTPGDRGLCCCACEKHYPRHPGPPLHPAVHRYF